MLPALSDADASAIDSEAIGKSLDVSALALALALVAPSVTAPAATVTLITPVAPAFGVTTADASVVESTRKSPTRALVTVMSSRAKPLTGSSKPNTTVNAPETGAASSIFVIDTVGAVVSVVAATTVAVATLAAISSHSSVSVKLTRTFSVLPTSADVTV